MKKINMTQPMSFNLETSMWHTLRPDAMSILKDKNTQASLSRYFKTMQDETPAKSLILKKIPANFKKDDSLQELWHIHEELLPEFYVLQHEIDSHKKTLNSLKRPEKTFMDLKIAIADHILESCHFCTRRCGVNRQKGELGYCKCGSRITVSSMFEHMGEEPELVPSGTIFTMGCTMRCLHCQNWMISQWFDFGEIYTPNNLALAVERLRMKGCRNANLVGGEPTPWLQQWLQTFKYVEVNVPVVWNSNSYYSDETAKLLAGFADIYLLDFKYGSNECASRISDAPNYLEVCERNHLIGKENGELIIRVLVLPGHLECCTNVILDWIVKNLGRNTRINIMFQYRPEWKAREVPELGRRLTGSETRQAVKLAKEAGLINFIT